MLLADLFPWIAVGLLIGMGYAAVRQFTKRK